MPRLIPLKLLTISCLDTPACVPPANDAWPRPRIGALRVPISTRRTQLGARPAGDVLEELGAEVIPLFPKQGMPVPTDVSEESTEFRKPASVG